MNTQPKAKEPLLGVLLTLIFRGLGHLYAKRIKRAIFIIIGLNLVLGPLDLYLLLEPTIRFNILSFVLFCAVNAGVTLWTIIDSYLCVKQFNRKYNLSLQPKKPKRVLLILLIAGIVLTPNMKVNPYYWLQSLVKNNFFEAFSVPDGPMEPTIRAGDLVLVSKLAYRKSDPQRGDVVVFRSPPDLDVFWIKRVKGIPGDSFEIRDYKFFVNEKMVGEYPSVYVIKNLNSKFQAEFSPSEIPPDKYFVLGDNSEKSYDSRHWGFLARENIIGKAFKIYWPIRRSGPIK